MSNIILHAVVSHSLVFLNMLGHLVPIIIHKHRLTNFVICLLFWYELPTLSAPTEVPI